MTFRTAQRLGCSLAVFAPGWTHECTPDGMDIDEYDSHALTFLPIPMLCSAVASPCYGWDMNGSHFMTANGHLVHYE
jgi:hypothetical protein